MLAFSGQTHKASLFGYGLTIGTPTAEPVVTAMAEVALAIVFLKTYAVIAAFIGSCAVPMIKRT